MSDPKAHPEQFADEFAPRERRLVVQREGKVLLQGGNLQIPVHVRNVSTEGAKLEFENFQLLPRQFELLIDDDALPVMCEKRWEDGKTCGVAFIDKKAEIIPETKRDHHANSADKPATKPVLGQIFAPVDWFDD